VQRDTNRSPFASEISSSETARSGGALGLACAIGHEAFRERVMTTAVSPVVSSMGEHQTITLEVTGSTPVPPDELQTRLLTRKRLVNRPREVGFRVLCRGGMRSARATAAPAMQCVDTGVAASESQQQALA
jgi:hypothetical protein